MQQVANQPGVYRISLSDKIFNNNTKVLDRSVPQLSGDEGSQKFGLVYRGIPLPHTGGCYVVEFLEDETVRIIAYIDRYGRAFSASDIVLVPPARNPSLAFERDKDKADSSSVESGYIFVYAQGGKKREVARYYRSQEKVYLRDSWYDFTGFDKGISYEHALARAYLAFVHRPSLGFPEVPTRGLRPVFIRLKKAHLSEILSLVKNIQNTEGDHMLKAPVLAKYLAQWLLDAGLEEVVAGGMKDESLRLVKRKDYSKTYIFRQEQDDDHISVRALWPIESALNRFLLISEALGEKDSIATEEDCLNWDDHIFDAVATQRPALEKKDDLPAGEAGGEWEYRCAVGAALERLRLPVRLDTVLGSDLAQNRAAFDLLICACGTQRLRNYALRVGILAAGIAFDTSPAVEKVAIVVRFLHDEEKDIDRELFGNARDREGFAHVGVVFSREKYQELEGFEAARTADPLELYKSCRAVFDQGVLDAFSSIESATSRSRSQDQFPDLDAYFAIQESLAGPPETYWDVNINFDVARMSLAELLAEKVVLAGSIIEAMRVVKDLQEKATAAQDDKIASSCINLMAALAEGTCDKGDKSAVIRSFLGEDRCFAALNLAKGIAQTDTDKAVDILRDAVMEVAALDGYIDGSNVIYRVFDSPVSRVLYNKARRTGEGRPQSAVLDREKRLELAPDSFYLCHLEIARLLERSFERSDEALYYGKRAMELAPSIVASYRQLGRMYMLVGNMEEAISVLKEGLCFAVHSSEIALLYYQLGYAYWKTDAPRVGAACYLKSLNASSSMAVQVTMELHELIEETGIDPLNPDKIDDELASAEIPIAPTKELLKSIGEAVVVAVDRGHFETARGLLSVYLCFHRDTSLVNVLRSLDEW